MHHARSEYLIHADSLWIKTVRCERDFIVRALVWVLLAEVCLLYSVYTQFYAGIIIEI